MPASPYDLCSQERDRLLDKVAALETELAEAKKTIAEDYENLAVLLTSISDDERRTLNAEMMKLGSSRTVTQDGLAGYVELQNKCDEARAERDALREALKYEVQEHSCGRIASCSSCLLLRDTTQKTEEGGK